MIQRTRLALLAALVACATTAVDARPRPRPTPPPPPPPPPPVIMKYTLSIYNATGAWNDPNANAKVGLGARVFDGPTHMVVLTGYADQSQIKSYSVIAKDGKRVDGQTVALTRATVQIYDGNYNLAAEADFLPGQVYVGTDLTNYGIGFGSTIYPIYPYAMLSVNVTGPQYTLDRDFMLYDYSLSCVGYAGGSCLNTRDGSVKYLLKTTQGDLWIGTEGITWSAFNAARQY